MSTDAERWLSAFEGPHARGRTPGASATGEAARSAVALIRSNKGNSGARQLPGCPALTDTLIVELGCLVWRLDACRKLTDNRVMSVARQARYPESVLCRFLDRWLPQRAVVVEDWARRAASAPWAGIYLPDAESRQRMT